MARDPARGKRLLVLGAGPAQLGLLAAARERELFVVAADRDPAAPGFRYADRRALVSAEDEVGIERLAQAERVDGLIAPGIDWPVAIAARVAARLGLSHPVSPDVAVIATSKLRQRERFAEGAVPQPRWTVVGPSEDASGFTLPCVVKAPDRQGQRGLSLVRDRAALRPAIEAALAAARGSVCLVEELVDGPEVTVNGFVHDGEFLALSVTDRLTSERPAFGVALAHVAPSEAGTRDSVDVAARAAAALGIEGGPTYTQIRLGPDGPKVVEVAARLGGGHDAELCRAVSGIDLNGAALAAALGEEPDLSAAPSRALAGCVRFLVSPEGELRAVAGVEAARAAEGVATVYLYRRAGQRLGPLRTGADRAGAVLAVADTREQALARAAAAAALIRFQVAGAEAAVAASRSDTRAGPDPGSGAEA